MRPTCAPLDRRVIGPPAAEHFGLGSLAFSMQRLPDDRGAIMFWLNG